MSTDALKIEIIKLMFFWSSTQMLLVWKYTWNLRKLLNFNIIDVFDYDEFVLGGEYGDSCCESATVRIYRVEDSKVNRSRIFNYIE